MESVLSSKYTNKPHGSNYRPHMIYDFHTHTGIAHFLLDTLNVFLNLKIIFSLLSNCFSYSYHFYNFPIAKNVALNLFA